MLVSSPGHVLLLEKPFYMARNFTNHKYDTQESAQAAINARKKAGRPEAQDLIAYPHWDEDGKKTWRVSSGDVFISRWEKNKCTTVKKKKVTTAKRWIV